jgi:hypothetical protein
MFISPNRDALFYNKAREIVRERAADRAFQHYLDWRQESSTSESAYRRWMNTAKANDRVLAFAAYTAALDREAQAATQYQAALSGA